MTDEVVMNLGREAIKTVVLLGAPILVTTLIVGLVVSVFQAITQINEQTLTFIPKIIVVAAVMVLAGPWMLDVATKYTVGLFENIPELVRE
jgi:flagellar biosynthetic protein FliQ